MEYAQRSPQQEEEGVVGGAYQEGAANQQAQGVGWMADDAAGIGAGGRTDGLQYFDGVGVAPEGQDVADFVAWIDRCVPAGVGVAFEGSAKLIVGIQGEGALSSTITNQGGGLLQVDATVALHGGMPALVGGKLGSAEAELGGEANQGVTMGRVFKIPYVQVVTDPSIWPQLLGSVALGSSGVEAGLHALGLVLGGVDLNPYLLEESYAVGQDSSVGASLGLLGEEVSWLLEGTVGAKIGLAWDDLPDANGHREGTLSLEATGEVLHQVALNLEKTAGIDVELPLPADEVTAALVVEITEDLGVITFGGWWVRGAASMEVACGKGEVGVELGPDHGVVDAALSLTVSHPIAGSIIEDVTATLPGVDVDGGSTTVTVGLSVPLSAELLAAGASAAQDVAQYLGTGQLPPALQAVKDLVDAALAAATVKVGVDMVLIEASAQFEDEAGAGFTLGVAAEGSASLVYQNDDVTGLLSACPSAADVVALLRSGAGAMA